MRHWQGGLHHPAAIELARRAALRARAPAAAGHAASAAVRRIDLRVDAFAVAQRRPAEALEIAFRRSAVTGGHAELSVRARGAARAAVLRIGLEVDARSSAVSVRAARPTALAARFALAVRAALARIANHTALAAVVVVLQQIHARGVAVGEALLAR